MEDIWSTMSETSSTQSESWYTSDGNASRASNRSVPFGYDDEWVLETPCPKANKNLVNNCAVRVNRKGSPYPNQEYEVERNLKCAKEPSRLESFPGPIGRDNLSNCEMCDQSIRETLAVDEINVNKELESYEDQEYGDYDEEEDSDYVEYSDEEESSDDEYDEEDGDNEEDGYDYEGNNSDYSEEDGKDDEETSNGNQDDDEEAIDVDQDYGNVNGDVPKHVIEEAQRCQRRDANVETKTQERPLWLDQQPCEVLTSDKLSRQDWGSSCREKNADSEADGAADVSYDIPNHVIKESQRRQQLEESLLDAKMKRKRSWLPKQKFGVLTIKQYDWSNPTGKAKAGTKEVVQPNSDEDTSNSNEDIPNHIIRESQRLQLLEEEGLERSITEQEDRSVHLSKRQDWNDPRWESSVEPMEGLSNGQPEDEDCQEDDDDNNVDYDISNNEIEKSQWWQRFEEKLEKPITEIIEKHFAKMRQPQVKHEDGVVEGANCNGVDRNTMDFSDPYQNDEEPFDDHESEDSVKTERQTSVPHHLLDHIVSSSSDSKLPSNPVPKTSGSDTRFRSSPFPEINDPDITCIDDHAAFEPVRDCACLGCQSNLPTASDPEYQPRSSGFACHEMPRQSGFEMPSTTALFTYTHSHPHPRSYNGYHGNSLANQTNLSSFPPTSYAHCGPAPPRPTYPSFAPPSQIAFPSSQSGWSTRPVPRNTWYPNPITGTTPCRPPTTTTTTTSIPPHHHHHHHHHPPQHPRLAVHTPAPITPPTISTSPSTTANSTSTATTFRIQTGTSEPIIISITIPSTHASTFSSTTDASTSTTPPTNRTTASSAEPSTTTSSNSTSSPFSQRASTILTSTTTPASSPPSFTYSFFSLASPVN